MTECKIAVVGPGSVGKSSLTLQFVHHHFNEGYPIATTLHRQQITVDDQLAYLDIQDTSEVEQCTRQREFLLSVGQGFVLVYSTTSKDSFDEITQFKNQICKVKDLDHVPMILVGNKLDLEHKREVSTEDGKALAKSWNVPFLEISAEQGRLVEEVFSELVRQIRAQPEILIPAKEEHGGISSQNCSIL